MVFFVTIHIKFKIKKITSYKTNLIESVLNQYIIISLYKLLTLMHNIMLIWISIYINDIATQFMSKPQESFN